MSNTLTDLYTNITNIEELSSVTQVLIEATYNRNPFVIAVENSSNNNRASVLGEFDEEGLLIFEDTMLLLDIQYDQEENTILFSYQYSPAEDVILTYYLSAQKGNNNRLRTTTQLSSTCYFTPVFDPEGNLTLTCSDEEVTRNMMEFNPQNSIFSCYASNYKDGIQVSLFKKYTKPTPPVPPTPQGEYHQYHFIDPLFFLDSILEFGVYFNWYPMTGYIIDDMGRKVAQYDKQEIFGSLQPQTGTINFSTTGNTHSLKYKFYCMSKYRINHGDFILYHDRYLFVDEVQEYDEAGVREVSLTMINLIDYRDFQDYLKYLNGEKTV